MTSKRDRANARRRQGMHERREAEKAAAAARTRRQVAYAGGAVAVVAVVAAVVAIGVVSGGDDEAEPDAVVLDDQQDAVEADAQDPAQADVIGGDAGLCPEPGLGPRSDAPQFDASPDPDATAYAVTLTTTCGDIVVNLDGPAAPQAVGSFVSLATSGFFDRTPCHRLTTAGIFVLQCGDPTGSGTGGPGYRFGPIENAPADDVYPPGTFAMARTGGDGQSMGSQFFIVYEQSTIPSDAAGGYSVMGTVTEGLDIVELVAGAGTAPDGVAPAQSIGIVSVTVEEAA